MTREEMARVIGQQIAFLLCGHGQPDMSGDQRNKLSPGRRVQCDRTTEEIVALLMDDAGISRALALLGRIGDEAADALIAGTAAVVPVEATPSMVLDGDTSFWESDAAHDASVAWSLMLSAGRLDRGGA